MPAEPRQQEAAVGALILLLVALPRVAQSAELPLQMVLAVAAAAAPEPV